MILSSTTRQNDPLSPREFQRIKTSIHEELVESLDLAAVGLIDDQQMRSEVKDLGHAIYKQRRLKLSQDDKGKLIDELADEVFGLGPIEPLLSDPSVSDILVNGAEEVFVERQGRLEKTDIVFADNAHVMRIIQRVVSKVGRRVDEASPMVDARLPDGSRVNAVIPPLALDGPKLSIRRFATDRLQLPQLQENGSLNAPIVEFLSACVAARIGVLISGGTGAGKTTLLNALSSAIPADERIVTIEDSAELSMNHPHVVKLETRDSNTEGSGEISQRDLVRNSLRMRPDRIIVGEVRGAESLDMLQAMNTGHEGSMTTIHANDTPDALKRLEMMVAMTGFELPIPVVRQYVAAGIRLVVHLSRLKGGVRRVMQVCEIVDADHGEYKLESVFGFRQQGLDEDGVAKGHFFTTGWTPSFIERFEDYGVQLSQDLFKAM
ncbi:MAG: CpaF family protein [Planctomycetota bacterium]|nr:CpaF family protein [Planctomycetota bacterium]